MRVLVACEESGVVRDAFRANGHEAFSCDLQPNASPWHLQCDARIAINLGPIGWDMIVAHPPCTDLAVSGARWFKNKGAERINSALDFVRLFLDHSCPLICVENPVSIISTRIRRPDQIIQPWMFGHGETKATCLWLKGLPLLRPTNIVDGRAPRVHHMAPGPNRARNRSRTLSGIADAMASQWGAISA